MFGIGETELLIIVAFGFMIFGPDKLPGMGRTIGRALRQFRQAQEGFTEVVQSEVMDPLQEAMGDPLDTGTRKQRRSTAEERAAALAQDADIDAPAGDTVEHKETFAERKARLAAERKAREEQAEAAAEASAQEAPAEQEAPAADEGAQESAATSAASLYALGGRSAYGAARQQEAQAAADDAGETSPTDKKEDTTNEKEAGSAQA